MSAPEQQRELRRRWPSALIGLAWISPWIVGFTAFTLLPVICSGY